MIDNKFKHAMILLFAFAITALNIATVSARTWTLSELDTLSDRKWLWVDEKYKEPISEYSTETERPDKLPECLHYSNPIYPENSVRVGMDGSVKLKILIDERGKVRAARILEDSGFDVGLEVVALKAARESVWKPAVKAGKNVAIWLTYESISSLIATGDGTPIKQLDLWDWTLGSISPAFGKSPNERDLSKDMTLPVDEFVPMDTHPQIAREIHVIYPEFARMIGERGSVWVAVLIARDGGVTRAKVVKKSGSNCGFEEEALWSAINSKWTPATFRGEPVASWAKYEIKFRLKSKR